MSVYPTRRAIGLMAAGAPVALLVATFAPGLWVLAAAWAAFVLALMLADGALAPAPRTATIELDAPTVLGAGRPSAGALRVSFAGAAPRQVELAVGGGERLAVSLAAGRLDLSGAQGESPLTLEPLRRGRAELDGLWARWCGPLGLVWRQRREATSPLAIVPDIQGVKEEALRLFTRDAPLGAKVLRERGEGSDFHALRDFQTGMDLRDLDWRASARRGKLIGREHRTERNHHVVLALDTGRLMCTPLAGLPRIDRAINAALLLAFVSLKMGDRVGLYAFDAKVRAASGLAAGAAAFPLLQRLASDLDYTAEETNFTLGFTALAGELDRRAIVVVFTDFVDATSAELMIESLGRLMRTHLVLFVMFRDEELLEFVEREPQTPEDVSRAVVAEALLRQREAVIARLRRLGAQIVDAPVEGLGPALLDAYLNVKRRGLV